MSTAGLLKVLVLSLLQMEQENQQLKMANLKQTEQILLLQDKLQGEGTHFLIILLHKLQILPPCRIVSFRCFDVSRRVSLISSSSRLQRSWRSPAALDLPPPLLWRIPT